MWKDEEPTQMKCQKFISNSTIYGVRWKPPELLENQGDRHNIVKETDELSKSDWREDLTSAEVYSAYRDIFVNRLRHIESMLGKDIGSI